MRPALKSFSSCCIVMVAILGLLQNDYVVAPVVIRAVFNVAGHAEGVPIRQVVVTADEHRLHLQGVDGVGECNLARVHHLEYVVTVHSSSSSSSPSSPMRIS